MNHLSQASAVGIIGGADGPTAIYVAGPSGLNIPPSLLIGMLLTVIVIAAIFVLLHLQKKRSAPTPAQKRADTDITVILCTSLAVFVIYMLFQEQIMHFAFGSGPLLLRTLAMASLQYGLSGLGMTIVCLLRKESFASHGLRAKGFLPAVGLGFLCFAPHLIFMLATGDTDGYMPFQGVKLTAEVLSASFPVNVLGMASIVVAWGFFEGFGYAVLADKINARFPTKSMWLNWGAVACAIFCILIHGAIGITPAGLVEMLTVFLLIYGMLVAKERTGNAWGCVFVFLFLWNAF